MMKAHIYSLPWHSALSLEHRVTLKRKMLSNIQNKQKNILITHQNRNLEKLDYSTYIKALAFHIEDPGFIHHNTNGSVRTTRTEP